jgi:hypothetical protein
MPVADHRVTLTIPQLDEAKHEQLLEGLRGSAGPAGAVVDSPLAGGPLGVTLAVDAPGPSAAIAEATRLLDAACLGVGFERPPILDAAVTPPG